MLTRTSRFVAGIACLAIVVAAPSSRVAGQEPVASPLTEQSLGSKLRSMGLNPKQTEKRYDFTFRAVHEGEEWKLSMSTVLSRNSRSVWVMAWLDRLPDSAVDVPRTALLRLLALNDRMGMGKFFTYIPANRRFVLQRVVPNRGLTERGLQAVFQDLGISVVETRPQWSVANWKTGSESFGAAPPSQRGLTPPQSTNALSTGSKSPPLRSSTKQTRFGDGTSIR